MKTFLVDEGIARTTILLLRSYGYNVESVRSVQLHGASDEEIARYAVEHQRMILTLDQDFGELYHFVHQGRADDRSCASLSRCDFTNQSRT